MVNPMKTGVRNFQGGQASLQVGLTVTNVCRIDNLDNLCIYDALARYSSRQMLIYIYNMYIDLGDFAGRLDGVQVPFVSLNHYNHPVSDGEIP